MFEFPTTNIWTWAWVLSACFGWAFFYFEYRAHNTNLRHLTSKYSMLLRLWDGEALPAVVAALEALLRLKALKDNRNKPDYWIRLEPKTWQDAETALSQFYECFGTRVRSEDHG